VASVSRFADTATPAAPGHQPIPAEMDQRNELLRDPLKPAQLQGSSSLRWPTAHSHNLTRRAACTFCYAAVSEWSLEDLSSRRAGRAALGLAGEEG
jgi:hypothetical protein